MFEAKKLLFYYCVSPVHMGAGSAIGAIDNPIQREVHTQHPMLAGSGLKGALRHHFNRVWEKDGLITRIFGPDTGASDFAGALSLSDAQLVALPVRSLKGAYVYATCPLALARLKRLALLAGITADWDVPSLSDGEAQVASAAALSNGKLILEAFEFKAVDGQEPKSIAGWLADNVLPSDDAHAHAFFRNKLKADLVILGDTDFAHFARHAMVVEPHVRIDDDSGTADGGALFYTENLPPESILVGLAQASVERFKKDKKPEKTLDADEILSAVLDGVDEKKPGIAGHLLQIGGDATTGRGLVLVHPLKQEKS